MVPGTDVVVAMLPDDAVNLQICEMIYEAYSNIRLVTRLNDFSLYNEFNELGVVVVYPATAMVNFLDNVVRAPQLASILLHDDQQTAVVQITITNPDIDGLQLRDIILPTDVLVVGITRNDQSIVPHGYTTLKDGDEVSLIGRPQSLDQAKLKLGF